jgi:hypothetical protein
VGAVVFGTGVALFRTAVGPLTPLR